MSNDDRIIILVGGIMSVIMGFFLAVKETVTYLYYYQHSHIYVNNHLHDNPDVGTSKYTLLFAGIGVALIVLGIAGVTALMREEGILNVKIKK